MKPFLILDQLENFIPYLLCQWEDNIVTLFSNKPRVVTWLGERFEFLFWLLCFFLALCVFHRKWDHLKTAILTFRMNILTVNTVINYSEMVFWWKSCFNVKHSPSIKPYNHVTTRPRGYLVITYVYLTPKFALMTFSHLGLLGVRGPKT